MARVLVDLCPVCHHRLEHHVRLSGGTPVLYCAWCEKVVALI